MFIIKRTQRNYVFVNENKIYLENASFLKGMWQETNSRNFNMLLIFRFLHHFVAFKKNLSIDVFYENRGRRIIQYLLGPEVSSDVSFYCPS